MGGRNDESRDRPDERGQYRGPVACGQYRLRVGYGPGAEEVRGRRDQPLTRPGPVIAGRLEERGREYQEMTGAKVNVATVPFADLFQKLLTDWATGTNSIDVGVFASGWAVELVDGGLLGRSVRLTSPTIDEIQPATTSRRSSANSTRRSPARPTLITIDGDFQMALLPHGRPRANWAWSRRKHLGRVSSRSPRPTNGQDHERRRRGRTSARACSRSATPSPSSPIMSFASRLCAERRGPARACSSIRRR